MLGYIRRFLSFIFSFIKRLFKSSHKETPILPSAFNTGNEPDEGWDNWEPMTSIKVDKKDDTETPQPQIDFFADMVPEFKQPAQIRIRSTSNDINPPPLAASRFAVDTAFNVTAASALGDLDDSDAGGGWAEEDALDDSEIIAVKNEALKQKRAVEREKRRKEKERSSKLS